jgi:mitochondrial fission protein ELM1
MAQPQPSSFGHFRPGSSIGVDVSVFPAAWAPTRSSAVRIFVGTQADQARAERVLAWSIRQLRSEHRNYEIHWIRSGGGTDELERAAFWVPQLCNGGGRALFCTVDQVFLSDPAELFDLPLGEYGFLGPATGDVSALLIDCEKLASAWSVERVHTASPRDLAQRAQSLRGPLPTAWDAVADHYSVGRSKRVRFATLHTQPWRPFPDRYVYQSHPNEELWNQLESGANYAGFEVFSRSAPSCRFIGAFGRPVDPASETGWAGGLSQLLGAHGPELVAHDFCIRRALAQLSSRRLAVYTLDMSVRWRHYLAKPVANDSELSVRWGADDTRVCGPNDPAADDELHADAVICANTLDVVPGQDLPWILDEVFSGAASVVHLGIRPARRRFRFRARTGDPVRRTVAWWVAQIEAVASRHPRVHWQAVFCAGSATEVRHGGRHLGNTAPTVWVLTDDRPGSTSQSTGLADALGWPYAIKKLRFSPAARLHNRLLGASRIGIDSHRSTPLAPPWPDLVIAAGRRSAPVAQWIRARNFGQTRLVQLGRKGGDAADAFDLVVTPSYVRLDPHPRRLVTSAPIHNITPERIRRASNRFYQRHADAKQPRFVVLVGGRSGQYQLDSRTAQRLGEDVGRLANDAGGSIFVTTSRRSGDRTSRALSTALSNTATVHLWSAGDREENPYLAFLGLADVFVTTGDSESMLAEAASVARPLYIYPLPERASYRWMRIVRDWVYARAHARRGGRATQRSLEYVCARSIELGFVRPTRDLRDLHESLIQKGVARHFGESFDMQPGMQPDTQPRKTSGDQERVVERVCTLLGFGAVK